MDRTCPHRARDDLQEGRTMLLTNTTITQTTTATVATGNAIVSGVESRGCFACPAHIADQPSEMSVAKRISVRRERRSGRVLPAMYLSHSKSWQQPWLSELKPLQAKPEVLLGLALGLSLS